MKYLITFIIIIFFSSISYGEPSGVISELMKTKVSQFTYGMHRCADRVEEEIYDINKIIDGFSPSRNLEIGFNNCYYDWEDNEIQIMLHIYERTVDNSLSMNIEMSNQLCENFMINIRREFVFKAGDNEWNFIVQQFGNEGFNLPIDDEMNKSLKNYIFIHIGNGTKTICKSKLEYDYTEEVLFFQ